MEKDKSADLMARLRTGGGLDLSAEIQDKLFANKNMVLGREFSGYELSAHIADGGMSRVFRARRVDGRFERDVAVKISPASVADGALRERFLQEQQILASLNHPYIAQLYDAGISEEGWPYIVMELIDGTPIDQYCTNANLTKKIALMVKICSALSFAHTQLVVHRDIKPGNVLVTSEGEPKLLDFGIAKLLSTNSSMTQTPSLTPRYASPEQLLGQPTSVASDIFQIGLLLAEILNADLIKQPETLSAAIQLAANGIAPALNRGISRSLPKELISIIEQCLRPNPVERYAQVSEVREDLTRYLSGFPVSASGNSRTYRIRKFIRRNMIPLASSAIATAVFILSGLWYLIEVTDARQRAELEAATSRQVTDFLTDLFRSSAPSQLRGEVLTASQLLERGVERIDQELDDRPRVHAQIQAALGSVYLDLGNYETAKKLLENALAVQRQELGEDHPSTLNTLKNLAEVAADEGSLEEAEKRYQQVIDLYTLSLGPNHDSTMSARSSLASTLRKQGEFAQAAVLQKEVLEAFRSTGQLSTEKGIRAISGLAISTIQAGDAQASLGYFQQALDLSREVLGVNHPQTLVAINNMAVTHQETGQPEQALPFSKEAYELALKIYGSEHHTTVRSAVNLSNTLRQLGRLDEARRYAIPAYETALASLPRSHAATDQALTEMGQLELSSNNFARAEALFLELLEIEFEHLGEKHMYTIGTQLKLASAIAAQNRFEDAAVLVEQAIKLMHETQGPEHHETLLAEKQLAGLRLEDGRLEEAREILQRIKPGLSEHLGEQARQVTEVSEMLANISTKLGPKAAPQVR